MKQAQPFSARRKGLLPSTSWVTSKTAPRKYRYADEDPRLDSYLVKSTATSSVEESSFNRLRPETVRGHWLALHKVLDALVEVKDDTGTSYEVRFGDHPRLIINYDERPAGGSCTRQNSRTLVAADTPAKELKQRHVSGKTAKNPFGGPVTEVSITNQHGEVGRLVVVLTVQKRTVVGKPLYKERMRELFGPPAYWPNLVIITTANGWVNSAAMPQLWEEALFPFIQEQRALTVRDDGELPESVAKELPVLVTSDNHKAHDDDEFAKKLDEEHITLWSYAAKGTSVLQPNDNGLHREEKRDTKKLVEEELQWQKRRLRRDKLGAGEKRIALMIALLRMRARLRRDLVCSAWRATGFAPPYMGGPDVDVVLGHPKLQKTLTGA